MRAVVALDHGDFRYPPRDVFAASYMDVCNECFEMGERGVALAEEVAAYLGALRIACVVLDERDASRGALAMVAGMAERSARRGCVVLLVSEWMGTPALDVYMAEPHGQAGAKRMSLKGALLAQACTETVVRRIVQSR